MRNLLLRFALSVLAAASLLAADAPKASPKILDAPSPGYPTELVDTGISGQAEVDITVKIDGTVADPQLGMATHRAFGRAAMAAVMAWKFEPGQREGAPVEMRVSIPFNFVAPLEQQINALAKRKVFVALPDLPLTAKEYGAKLKVKRPARPFYPRGVAGQGRDVTVQVTFVVAPDGSTLNPSVTGSPPKEFVAPALLAVAQMAYEPLAKNGKAVYVETTTKLEFTNDRGGFGGEGGRGGGARGGGGSRGGGGGGMGGGGGSRGGGEF